LTEVTEALFTLFIWILGGAAFAFVVVRILNAWLADKLLTAPQALGLILLIVLFFALVWSAAGQQAMIAYVAVMLGVAGGAQLLHVAHERRLAQRLHAERMLQYRAVIARDPKNAAAHVFLAESLAELGQYDEAIAEMQAAIELAPERATQERYRLQKLVAAKTRAERGPVARCYECRAENPRGSRACARCGASLNTSFFVWLFTPAHLREVLYRSAIPVLIAIIVIAILSRVSIAIAGIVLAAALAAGTVYLLCQFARDE